MLDSRLDRLPYRKTLAAICKIKGNRYNDPRIGEKIKKIEGKMNIQRAPNSMQ
jgi:hypothetical protein